MTTLTEEPLTESAVMLRAEPAIGPVQRVAVWSGVVGFSLLAWTAAFAGFDALLG